MDVVCNITTGNLSSLGMKIIRIKKNLKSLQDRWRDQTFHKINFSS